MTPEHFTRPENPFRSARTYWESVAISPSRTLQASNVMRTAFGSGVTLLAPGAKIYEAIKSNWPKERGEIVGCDFTLQEIRLIRGYYADLLERYSMSGISCMDERLNVTTCTHGIHEHCGAAAALGEVIEPKRTGEAVEDYALELLGHKDGEKERLIPGMDHHEAVAVMVTLGHTPYSLNPDKYEDARANGALPFHTFISIEDVVSFAQKMKVVPAEVFEALMKWNLQIAINIMGGEHNAYKNDVKDKNKGVLAVIDTRGVDTQKYGPLLQQLDRFLKEQTITVKNVNIADTTPSAQVATVYPT